jgi:alkylation response protein AidB-like acyl-CoA dehydrogenase
MQAAAQQTDSFDAVARARELRPLFEANAERCETERRVPDEVIQALHDAGLMRMMHPRRAGGPGVPLIAHIETIAEIAKGCASTAWVFGLLSGIAGTAAGLPVEATSILFPAGDELFCSASAPTGTATKVDGGYRVTGRWGYGSGCLHAAWAMNGVVVLGDDGAPVDGGFAIISLHDPHVTIEDTWHVTGVAGSGSNTIVAAAVFVPDALMILASRTPDPLVLLSIEGLEPRDKWPMEPLFPLIVFAPMLGAVDALLEKVAAAMSNRRVAGWGYASHADSQILVGQLGLAAMEIDGAWLHVRRAAAMLDETAQHRPISGFEKARIQADCGRAAELVRSAAERLMDVAGPAAFATSSPLQRIWRDLSLGARHNAVNARLSMELYGRALLGRESNIDLIPDIVR